MSNQQHTPGPWYLSGTTVYALNAQNFNRFCAQVQDAHTPKAELEANARLIAAAPDLLEALEMIVAEADSYTARTGKPVYNWLDQARAAIAKARGEV